MKNDKKDSVKQMRAKWPTPGVAGKPQDGAKHKAARVGWGKPASGASESVPLRSK